MALVEFGESWGFHAPGLHMRLWISAVRLAPPWLRRIVQRHVRKNLEPHWTAPMDIAVRGVRYRAHFKDNAHERKLVFQGRRLDRWHLRALKPFLRPGGTFVDIGANCGFFALNAARFMADSGRVLAIEPSRELAARLRENVRLNGLRSVLVREVATGDSRGLAAREASAADHGSAAFTAVGAEQDGIAAVEMIPLLDIVQHAGLDRIDALKIDIEGMEDRALVAFFASAPQNLWPRAIALEISHRQLWRTDVVADLEDRGYRVITRGRVDLVFERQQA